LISKKIPSLDGLRGVAILMVVIDHALNHYPNSITEKIRIVFNGELGVLIFFVLSGYLITTLLLREQAQNNKISLKKFYIRRFLRIFPVAYLYIFIVFFIDLFFDLGITYLTLVGAILYLRNLSYFKGDWLFGHFWSLAVEEQFYLWFPQVIRKNINKTIIILIFICFFISLIKILDFHSNLRDYTTFYITYQLTKNLDGILMGCIMALATYKGYIPVKFIDNNKLFLNLLSCVIIVFFVNNMAGISHKYFNNTISSFFIGLIVLSNTAESKDFVFKFLNNKFLAYIGVLSYSIYVWQQLFMIPPNKLLVEAGRFPISSDVYDKFFFIYFPCNFIFLGLFSLASYYFYEKKFLALKIKYQVDE